MDSGASWNLIIGVVRWGSENLGVTHQKPKAITEFLEFYYSSIMKTVAKSSRIARSYTLVSYLIFNGTNIDVHGHFHNKPF